jgi:hypothetical protein
MSHPLQTINERILDDLRRSRAEQGRLPDGTLPQANPRRDAEEESADTSYSTEVSDIDDTADLRDE